MSCKRWASISRRCEWKWRNKSVPGRRQRWSVTCHTRLASKKCSRLLGRKPLLFLFNDTAPTQIYTLSLHDALPISSCCSGVSRIPLLPRSETASRGIVSRSEEHTSELQSQSNRVCRLLLEKKN